jgi:tetratricopeptide (TPR) repeat protein
MRRRSAARCTAAGLEVTARVGASPGATAQDADAEFDQLVQRAAEAVYAQTQPYRYAVFVASHGRQSEALAAFAKLAMSGAVDDRPWAYAGWGNLLGALGDRQGALEKEREAIRLGTHVPAGYVVLIADDIPASHWQEDTADLAAQRLNPSDRTVLVDMIRDTFRGNYEACAARLSAPSQIEAEGGLLQLAAARSQCLALDHDVSPAQRAATVPPDAPFTDPKPVIDLDMEDWSAMARDGEADALIEQQSVPNLGDAMRRLVGPYRPLAYAALGRRGEADPLIAATPLDCDPCVETRGRIATIEGDWRMADLWFGALVRQTPGIPLGNNDWGASYLARGDLDAAIVQFKLAHDKGPNWADPLEGWGAALMKKGDVAGAVEKFAEADRDAPRWGRNHLRWGEALAWLDRTDEARAQWRAAAAMDLSAADRAELARVFHG